MSEGLPAELQGLPDGRGAPAVAAELAGLGPLAERLGHAFARPELLRVALTLRSWLNEHPKEGWACNECLEFFGDAVLDLVSADQIWRRWGGEGEGSLTRLQAALVSEPALARVAREIGLGAWLRVGRGDEAGGARDRDGPLADALEAVLGAVFLDARAAGGDPLAAVGAVFDRLFAGAIAGLHPERTIDAKSRLGRWVERHYRASPRYECALAEEATAERPWWRARVVLDRGGAAIELGAGEGSSKREAQRAAARAGLERVEGGWRPG